MPVNNLTFRIGLSAIFQLTTHYSFSDWKNKIPFQVANSEVHKVYVIFGIHYLVYHKNNMDFVVLLSRKDPALLQLKVDKPDLFQPFLTLKSLNRSRQLYLPNSISLWLWSFLFLTNFALIVLEASLCGNDIYCTLKTQVWGIIIIMTLSILFPFLIYYWRARKTTSNIVLILLKTEVVTLVTLALLISGYIVTSDPRQGLYYTQLYKARSAIFRK